MQEPAMAMDLIRRKMVRSPAEGLRGLSPSVKSWRRHLQSGTPPSGESFPSALRVCPHTLFINFSDTATTVEV